MCVCVWIISLTYTCIIETIGLRPIARMVRVDIGRLDENIRTTWMRRGVKVVRGGTTLGGEIDHEAMRKRKSERKSGGKGEGGARESRERERRGKRMGGREPCSSRWRWRWRWMVEVVRRFPLNKCDRSSKLVAKLYDVLQTGLAEPRLECLARADSFWRIGNYRSLCHAYLDSRDE